MSWFVLQLKELNYNMEEQNYMKNMVGMLEDIFSNKKKIRKKSSKKIAELIIESCEKDILCGFSEKYDYLKSVWENGSAGNGSFSDIIFSKEVSGLIIILLRRKLIGNLSNNDIEFLAQRLIKNKKHQDELYSILTVSDSVSFSISFIDDFINNHDQQNDAQKKNTIGSLNYPEIGKSLTEFKVYFKSFGEQINELEKHLREETVQNGFNQMLQVFNILGDIKDSIDVEKTDNEIRINNINEIQDMIIEFVEDYGIESFCSSSGTPYDSRIQEIYRKKRNDYDPKRLIIANSVRCGFKWGKTVVQKEKVLVEEVD